MSKLSPQVNSWLKIGYIPKWKNEKRCVCQAVGYAGNAAVHISFGVVDGLNTPSARDVVFGSRYLYAAVIRQRAYRLHQSLAEGAIPDDHSPVEVLQGSGKDFGSCTSTASYCRGMPLEAASRSSPRWASSSPAARTASTSRGPSPSTGGSSTWGSPSSGSATGCSS